MKWNEPYRFVERYVIGNDIPLDNVIQLTKKYRKGKNELKVFYNGLSAMNGREYEELDNRTIRFLVDLQPGDEIEIEFIKG
ncbi:MAG: hypothetical protein N2043_01950 [Ignavibacterium sp.]|nr:hypothetical protein [Ignavibacterium sp.]